MHRFLTRKLNIYQIDRNQLEQDGNEVVRLFNRFGPLTSQELHFVRSHLYLGIVNGNSRSFFRYRVLERQGCLASTVVATGIWT